MLWQLWLAFGEDQLEYFGPSFPFHFSFKNESSFPLSIPLLHQVAVIVSMWPSTDQQAETHVQMQMQMLGS